MQQPLHIRGPRWQPISGWPEGWGSWLHKPLNVSITEITEGAFVNRILNDLHYRSNIFNVKDLDADGALIKPGVELREFRKDLAGDIDILIVPRDRPDLSTNVQIKRLALDVRWTEDDYDNDDPQSREFKDWERKQLVTKWQSLYQEGIRQANFAAKIGFSQVYLWSFVLADTRWVNGGRYTYDGPDAYWRSAVDCALSPVGLDARVGVMHYEWVQPMDRPPLELATYGGSFGRLASRTEQPRDLTAWLSSLFRSAQDFTL